MLTDVQPMNLSGVEKQLAEYREIENFEEAFNFARAVVAPVASPAKQKEHKNKDHGMASVPAVSGGGGGKKGESTCMYGEMLNGMPQVRQPCCFLMSCFAFNV